MLGCSKKLNNVRVIVCITAEVLMKINILILILIIYVLLEFRPQNWNKNDI